MVYHIKGTIIPIDILYVKEKLPSHGKKLEIVKSLRKKELKWQPYPCDAEIFT